MGGQPDSLGNTVPKLDLEFILSAAHRTDPLGDAPYRDLALGKAGVRTALGAAMGHLLSQSSDDASLVGSGFHRFTIAVNP
jgi:hypothetical protein